MTDKIRYGVPNFVLTFNKRNYGCKYIVKQYGTYFNKFDDLHREITLKDRIFDGLGMGELENVRQCLLYNGYKIYGEFVAEFYQKERILNGSFKYGKYNYEGYTIINRFDYLGSKRVILSVTNGYSRDTWKRYYKHLECGGCVKEISLQNGDKDNSLFLCGKCHNCYSYNDINATVSITLRSPPKIPPAPTPQTSPTQERNMSQATNDEEENNSYPEIEFGDILNISTTDSINM